MGILQFVTDVTLYVLITHVYRSFALANGWDKMELNSLLKRLIIAVAVMGMIYAWTTLAKIWLLRVIFFTGDGNTFELFLRENGLNIFIAGIRLMSIWLLAYHLYHYAIREINITKENARLQLLQKDARLSHLSAQLNPHFLFNAMNTIKSLIAEDPVSARRGIDLLSEILRSGLNNGDQTMVSLETEINLISDYLEFEKLRLEERLMYKIDIAHVQAILSKIIVPRLSIQTLVENAVKHGINQIKAGGMILVMVSREKEYLKVLVSNSGKIGTGGPLGGHGLKSLRERLALCYKEGSSFSLTEQDSKVLATVIIPL